MCHGKRLFCEEEKREIRARRYVNTREIPITARIDQARVKRHEFYPIINIRFFFYTIDFQH